MNAHEVTVKQKSAYSDRGSLGEMALEPEVRSPLEELYVNCNFHGIAKDMSCPELTFFDTELSCGLSKFALSHFMVPRVFPAWRSLIVIVPVPLPWKLNPS